VNWSSVELETSVTALREVSKEVTEKSFMDVVVHSGEEVVVVAVEGVRKVDLIGLASENMIVIVAVTERMLCQLFLHLHYLC
jgi:hypothetical protein